MIAALDSMFDEQHRGLFVRAWGQWCGDADDEWIGGSRGKSVAQDLLIHLHVVDVLPLKENIDALTDDVLYDIVEFLHDHAAKPTAGTDHSFYRHTHWTAFDVPEGQREFREDMNAILRFADPPVMLHDDGCIRLITENDSDFTTILSARLPSHTPDPVRQRVDAAVEVFRAARTIDNLRHAVRDLADALEAMRTDLTLVIGKADEGILFETFNKFGIRHLKAGQRLDYGSPFLRWLFYVNLATVHLILRLQDRQSE